MDGNGTTDPRLIELRKKFNNGRKMAVCNPFQEVKKQSRTGVEFVERIRNRYREREQIEREHQLLREQHQYEQRRREYMRREETRRYKIY